MTIDLRTKLYFLLGAPLLMFIELNMVVELLIVFLYCSLFLFTQDYKWFTTFFVFYIFQVCLYYILPIVSWHPFIIFTLSFIAIGLRQMILSIISGTFLLKTTSISEWLFLLNRWRLPKGMIIAVAVMVRFVSTIVYDYQIIKQSMAIRGIDTSFVAMIKYPLKTFEYMIIPVLMNTSFTARDLTISVLTKGISQSIRPTSYRTYLMSWVDWLLIGILTTLWIGGVKV